MSVTEQSIAELYAVIHDGTAPDRDRLEASKEILRRIYPPTMTPPPPPYSPPSRTKKGKPAARECRACSQDQRRGWHP